MPRLMFADTETTGVDEDDRLCQLAFKCGSMEVNELYKPPVPIKLTAMMVHHITQEMVAKKPAFKKSQEHKLLKKRATNDIVFVAHNAQFDLKMLEREGIKFKQPHICTLKVARHLDEKCKMECYKLQYFRYLYKMDIKATAHDAWGDILVLEEFYNLLVKKMCKDNGYGADDAIAEMMEISSKPSFIRKFTFGKHIDKMIVDVAKQDRGYLEWLLGQKEQANEAGDEDMIHTLREVLNQPF